MIQKAHFFQRATKLEEVIKTQEWGKESLPAVKLIIGPEH